MEVGTNPTSYPKLAHSFMAEKDGAQLCHEMGVSRKIAPSNPMGEGNTQFPYTTMATGARSANGSRGANPTQHTN